MFRDEPLSLDSNILSELMIKGVKPKDGDVRINSGGENALALKYGNKCYKKIYTEDEIKPSEPNPTTCSLD